jgi:hypothetical protein
LFASQVTWADWGHPAEYAKADGRIARLLEAVGVPREHFFAVPGNHDVQRRVQEAAWQGIRNWLERTPGGAARIGRWLNHVEGPPPGVLNSWREELRAHCCVLELAGLLRTIGSSASPSHALWI